MFSLVQILEPKFTSKPFPFSFSVTQPRSQTTVPSGLLVLTVHNVNLSHCIPVCLIVYSQGVRSGLPEEADKSELAYPGRTG